MGWGEGHGSWMNDRLAELHNDPRAGPRASIADPELGAAGAGAHSAFMQVRACSPLSALSSLAGGRRRAKGRHPGSAICQGSNVFGKLQMCPGRSA